MPIREAVSKLCAAIFEIALGNVVSTPSKVGEILKGNGMPAFDSLLNLGGSVDSTAKEVIKLLQPTGYALCVLFFIIALLELAMSERMTMEYFVKFLSKLVVGYAVVYYCPEIYDTLREIGYWLMDTISADNPDHVYNPNLADVFINYTSNNGAGSWFPLLCASILIGGTILIGSYALLGVVYIVLFTWVLEMGVRGMFLPIACSLLSDDGWRGAGGRYIRKFLGICSQGMVMAAVMRLIAGIMDGLIDSIITTADGLSGATDAFAGSNSFIGNLAGTCIIVLGVMIAGVSVMMKSMSVVSDVFGG